MITTVTLNPAIDKTLILENLVVNDVNRVKYSNINAGGKGINASKIIQALGYETTALGFLGGVSGKRLLSMIYACSMPHDFIWLDENTRTNTKIIDIANNTCTDINEEGPLVDTKRLNKLKAKIKKYSEQSEIIILSGSVQKDVEDTIYEEIINENKNVKIILDASGEVLKNGIKAIPWLIKPNISELSYILDKKLDTLESIIFEAKKLNEMGIEYVCVSMGSEGLLLSSKTQTIKAVPPNIIPKSTVGAGDLVVGSLAVGLLKNNSICECVKFACAVGTAKCLLEGTQVPSNKQIMDIYDLVKTVEL